MDAAILLPLFGTVTAKQTPLMARRHQASGVKPGGSFKGRQFIAEVIFWAVRWALSRCLLTSRV